MFRIDRYSRTSRRGVLAVAAAASLFAAACNDDITAPGSAPAPTLDATGQAKGGGKPSAQKSVIATMKITDVNGALITELPTALFIYQSGGISVQDNSAADLDPTPGMFKVLLPAGEPDYKGCADWWTDNYTAMGDKNSFPTCNTVTAVGNKADIGAVFMRKMPIVHFRSEDMVGNPLPYFAVWRQFDGQGGDTIEDGEPGWDPDGLVNALIDMKFPNVAFFEYCEVIAPTNYQLANPACGSFDLEYEREYVIVLRHESSLTTHPR